MTTRSCLYVGQVFHRRTRPRVHALRYRVFSLLVDLEEIDALAAAIGPFSRNRFNLFSFHDADFGSGGDEPLERYVARELAAAGIVTAPARILLSCYPRVLGYGFNPLSLFYCVDVDGRVFAVVHEVHNTFGERHAYALAVDPPLPVIGGAASGDVKESGARAVGEPVRGEGSGDGGSGEGEPDGSGADGGGGRWIRQRADKALFVSPFNHLDMRYEFRLDVPAERQVIAIRVFDDAGLFLTASYVAERRPLGTRTLLALFAKLPLMTVKVIAGIHWEAARLWTKRVPWFTHRPKRAPGTPRALTVRDRTDPSFNARNHVRHR